tara:strand:+ start:2593 stop:2835 length:243 start_codon:yes stop_codon:yes gene_type:complete
MKFSKFIELLKKNEIDFEYDGWNHRAVLHLHDNPMEEYDFRIYLQEDDDSNIRNKPIAYHKNPIATLRFDSKFEIENKNK